jgi:hypothetical protein
MKQTLRLCHGNQESKERLRAKRMPRGFRASNRQLSINDIEGASFPSILVNGQSPQARNQYQASIL